MKRFDATEGNTKGTLKTSLFRYKRSRTLENSQIFYGSNDFFDECKTESFEIPIANSLYEKNEKTEMLHYHIPDDAELYDPLKKIGDPVSCLNAKENSGRELGNSKVAKDVNTGECYQIQPREKLPRLFTGTIEHLYSWIKLKQDVDVVFEIVATLNAIHNGHWQCEKILKLRDLKSGPTIQVFYYEIDRPLPKIAIGSTVICVGKLHTNNRFQVFRIDQTTEEDRANCQRIAYICNRVADELTSINKKNTITCTRLFAINKSQGKISNNSITR
ncbi:hypothetical protein RUM44_007586 [Polyplax serrata]|uniref:Uncharacterized protein n=1 Tax=Polyplax serrata TaxID=468196 RepID=A0ABR1BA12_POLSC